LFGTPVTGLKDNASSDRVFGTIARPNVALDSQIASRPTLSLAVTPTSCVGDDIDTPKGHGSSNAHWFARLVGLSRRWWAYTQSMDLSPAGRAKQDVAYLRELLKSAKMSPESLASSDAEKQWWDQIDPIVQRRLGPENSEYLRLKRAADAPSAAFFGQEQRAALQPYERVLARLGPLERCIELIEEKAKALPDIAMDPRERPKQRDRVLLALYELVNGKLGTMTPLTAIAEKVNLDPETVFGLLSDLIQRKHAISNTSGHHYELTKDGQIVAEALLASAPQSEITPQSGQMGVKEAGDLVFFALGKLAANQGPFGVDAKAVGATTGLPASTINGAVQFLKARGLVESFTGIGTSDGYDFLHVKLTAQGREVHGAAGKSAGARAGARQDGQNDRANDSRSIGMDNSLKQQIEAAGWQVWDPVTPKATGGGQCFFCCRTRPAEALGQALFDAHNAHSNPGIQHYRPPLMNWLRTMWKDGIRLDELVGVVKVAHAADARFEREIRVLKTLQHPNLIRVYAHDESSPPKWFVMQWHEGGDLERKRNEYHNRTYPMSLHPAHEQIPERMGVATFRGSISEVMRSLRGVADAMAVLHQGDGMQKIIHRDFKPGNVLVAGDGRWILTDLGIALDTEAERLTGSELQLSRDWRPDWVVKGEHTERMDIEMLAKIAYYLVAGVKPPPFSQFQLPKFDVRRLQLGVHGIEELHRFLNDHIAATEDGVKSRTAVELISAIDEVLARLAPDREPHLLYSFTSTRDQSNALGETVSSDLGGIPVLIPRYSRRITAYARVRGISPKLWFILEQRRRNLPPLKSSEQVVHGGSGNLGVWQLEPMELKLPSTFEPGEYRLTVCTDEKKDFSVSAFIVYAD